MREIIPPEIEPHKAFILAIIGNQTIEPGIRAYRLKIVIYRQYCPDIRCVVLLFIHGRRHYGCKALRKMNLKPGELNMWLKASRIAPLIDERDRPVLRAVDDLTPDFFVSSRNSDALTSPADMQKIDAVLAAGQYTQVSMLLNSLGIQPELDLELKPDVTDCEAAA